MNFSQRLLFLTLFICSQSLHAQGRSDAIFKIIPLGVKGGTDESNLSSYMVALEGTSDFICLDAGTLHFGLQQAVKNGLLTGDPVAILRTKVKAFVISHPHLDHVSGLILNSPDDSSKNIYALPFCIDVLKNNYFTWQNWANFADAGDKPFLGKYHYVFLDTTKETAIENTKMFVQPFVLSHAKPNKSTAFLIRYQDAYLLYLGDTGADATENVNNLYLLWKTIVPLINTKKLKAIFVETSFPDEQPTGQLFGHLTPTLLMKELKVLGSLTGNALLKDFPVVITHIKPGSGNAEEKIKKQLEKLNSLEVKLIFAEQAKMLQF
ncbi:MAG TPA: 3',5'-cyclic-nucleotide phosphodiesterase [Puia sp.]|jgi:cAMP phosphodiesterase|nr:3',5'-cyclic-nucleotide phosphodiesterase [Puia sp.]